MTLRLKIALVTLALAGVAFVLEPHAHKAQAESGAQGYPPVGAVAGSSYFPDKQTTAWVAAQGMASSTSIATLTSTTSGQFIIGGRQTISVGGRFDTAGQTVKVRLLYQYSTSTSSNDVSAKFVNLSSALTITATSFTDAAGKFIGPPVVFDTMGATHCYVVIDTPPAFNQVTLWVGSQ